MKLFGNDKDLSIVAMTVICIMSMMFLELESKDIILTVIGALGGLTIGQKYGDCK